MSASIDLHGISHQPGCCAICGGPNGCRMESGDGYKGRCWCERLTLSEAALRRLTEELPQTQCLCQNCLSGLADEPGVTWAELARRGALHRGD